jgi:pimeloyl-ACP methyl ester carboxylesterase
VPHTMSIQLTGVSVIPETDGSTRVELRTQDLPVSCRYYAAPTGDAAVLWVFGAGGGWGGPAGGLYPRLGQTLTREGVSSLEVAYRYPGRLDLCVADVLLAVEWLASERRRRVLLVGHSFGGAVVINAAAISDRVIGVAALSSQSFGGDRVRELKGKPVLLAHGEADEVLPDRCSRDLFRMACEPKTLLLYPGCHHGLDQCVEQLDNDLLAWLRRVISATPSDTQS